jgi:hypothetical protein
VRTTLTLDDDVAAKLKSEVRRSGNSFKKVLNDLLRLALNARRLPERRPFEVAARPLHLRPGLGYDNVGDILEQLEGPQHR